MSYHQYLEILRSLKDRHLLDSSLLLQELSMVRKNWFQGYRAYWKILEDLKNVPGLSREDLLRQLCHNTGSTIVVSSEKQAGEDSCTSIQEALDKASHGSRILISPGIYREQLVVNKEVEIIGQSSSDCIIEGTEENCFSICSSRVLLRGLSIKQKGVSQGHSVELIQGKLFLEDCLVYSEALAAVMLNRTNFPAVIRNCLIQGRNNSGIVLAEESSAVIENCEIYGSALAAIQVLAKANPTIRGCKIHGAKQSGILISEKASALIEHCDIFENAFAGISVNEGGHPIVRHCTIHDGRGSGIAIHKKGTAIIEECNIVGNARSGISISEGGYSTIRRCKINRNQYDAIWARGNALATVEDCELVS